MYEIGVGEAGGLGREGGIRIIGKVGKTGASDVGKYEECKW